LDFVIFVATSYLKTDMCMNHRKVMKAEPSRLLSPKFAGNQELLIV